MSFPVDNITPDNFVQLINAVQQITGVEINVENIFDYSYLNLIKPEKITPFIQSEGVTIKNRINAGGNTLITMRQN